MDFASSARSTSSGPTAPIELDAAKQRALLATLLLAHREEAVPAARLIDVLWGEAPPATAAKALQVHISQLRRALGPGSRSSPARRATRSSSSPVGSTSSASSRWWRGRARSVRPAARGGRAAARGAGAVPRAAAGRRAAARAGGVEAGRLAGLRLAALEERLDVDLALGRARGGRGRARGAGRRAPVPRAAARAADARALPRGPPGRRARGLPARPRRARRGARARPRPGAPAPRGGDPRAGPGARPRRAAAADPGGRPAAAAGADDTAARAARRTSRPPPTLLADPGVRLLTVTGPGGIGKTRLALELARRLGAELRGRCALRAAGGDRRAGAGGARARPGARRDRGRRQSAFDALAAHLAGLSVLLVLDNFEQVLGAAPDVARLLAASPRVKLVATSRSPLHVAGEQELAISPLARAPARRAVREPRAGAEPAARARGRRPRADRAHLRAPRRPPARDRARRRAQQAAPARRRSSSASPTGSTS